MAYEEYDYYNEPAGDGKSLKESLREILNGLQDRNKLREAGISLKEALQLTPNVTESLGRGGVAQAIGTSGDLREMRNDISSYLPKGVRNFIRAAEFLANPYATAIQQTAPTTEETLDFVPRVTDKYQGYKQHETLGEFVAPSLGYFGGKAAKAYGEYVGPTAYKAVENYLIKTGGIQQMMAGEKSNHPNYKSKALAEELELKNADPIQIRDATGLIRGPDQKWRTEISDQFSKIKENPLLLDKERFTDKNYSDFGALYEAKLRTPGSYGRVHLSDVFESPELEKYYPHLFDKRNPNGVTIKLAPEDARYMGRVEDEGRTISIKPGMKAADARRILNHEIQHIVQKYEGHATGGSPDSFTQQEDAKIAAQALSIRREAERMDENIPWFQRYRASYELHKGLGMDISPEAYAVAQNPITNPTRDMENLTKLYGTDKNIDPYSPMKMYERIGGEAEARLTENRMDMTDAERAQNFPYEYTPRRLDENLQPKPITGLDVRLEDQIIHGHKPNTIDIGGKRIFGTPDQATPESVELPKSEPDRMGFHSPLENFINDLKSPKGTGEQFLRQFEKEPSIKADELEMTGIKKFLQENPKVTKQELQDYIKQNRVELDQIVKGEATEDGYGDYQLQGGDVYHDDDYIRGLADDLHYDMKNDDVIRDQERAALLENDPDRYMDWQNNDYVAARLEQDIDGSLWDQAKSQAEEMYYENPIRSYYDDYGYEVYGNDDNGYSIKGPNGRFLDIGPRNGMYDISDAEDALRGHLLDEGIIDIGGDGARHESHSLPGNYDNYREVLVTLPEQYKKGSRDWMYESHYDEPNVLGHVRLDDRTIDGKKTLFVEEVQSDWHQHGRDEGYAIPPSDERKMEIRLQLDKLSDMKSYARSQRDAAKNEGLSTINEDKRLAELERQDLELRSELSVKGVPDAPYKKNWHEMLMKQVMDIAAKGDYDAVAFTTGSQQNKRWSLSKHIDSVDLIPAKDGDKQYVLQGWKDGRNIIRKAVNEDELPNYIGIEVAKKLLAQEPKGLHRPEGIAHGNPNVFEGRELSGLELETGGEPMKKFYDRDIPNFINKYGKKWGIGMKKANLPGNDNRYIDFKDWVNETNPSLHESFINDSYMKKDELFQEWSKSGKKPGEEVHLFDMPEKAKDDIKKYGQPLFSGIGLVAGSDYLLGAGDQQKTGILKDLMKQKY
jgi:hypothetical protein